MECVTNDCKDMVKTDIIDLLPLLDKAKIVPKDGFEIIEENGEYFLIEKKTIYPNSFEECYAYIPIIKQPKIARMLPIDWAIPLEDFSKLLLCRDVYWKIAGDWTPEWVNYSPLKYCITYSTGEIKKKHFVTENRILAFPTEEMRDAFYENFKDLIEKCKEFL